MSTTPSHYGPGRQAREDSLLHASVHGSIAPAAVFGGGKVSVKLRRKASDEAPLMGKLWHISPFGVEVLQEDAAPLRFGEMVELDLTLRDQDFHYTAQVTGTEVVEEKGTLVGLRFQKKERKFKVDLRKVTRWDCDPVYLPTGVAKNEMRFSDDVYFHVKNISAAGMMLYTSLRNKHLLPGGKLEAKISFPCIGDATFRLRITHINEVTADSKPYLAVGVSFASTSETSMALCGQYLLQFGSHQGAAPNASVLRAQGLSYQSSAKAMEFAYVRTKEEYDEVLALRLRAYRSTLAVDNKSDPEDWADIFDSRARILLGRHRGRTVASARIVFFKKGDKLETERYVQLPPAVPPSHDIAEISRVCADPDYRGSDTFIHQLRHIFLTVIHSGRRYILINCTGEMKNIYQPIGMRPVGATFTHANDGKVHHVLLMDVQRCLAGRDLGPKFWTWLVYPIWNEVGEVAAAQANPLHWARVKSYYLIAKTLDRYMGSNHTHVRRKSKPR